jgi:hypothetical protein
MQDRGSVEYIIPFDAREQLCLHFPEETDTCCDIRIVNSLCVLCPMKGESEGLSVYAFIVDG